MAQSNDTNVNILSPSLPKGGGSIKGMQENIGAPGSDGIANFNLPLSATPARYITPELSLSYSSAGGNGPFGIGWNIGIPRITRRTNKGIPKYTNEDQFLGPDGEVLVPERTSQGEIISRKLNILRGKQLDETYLVTRYFPKIQGSFNLIEYWDPQEGSTKAPFWLMHSSNGILHCFGKNNKARISSYEEPYKIAEWLLEESLSPFGEHVYYQYKEEDKEGINIKQDNHKYANNRYLKHIFYGNKIPSNHLYVLNESLPEDDQWLYSVILDYGENQISSTDSPLYSPEGKWAVRDDSFSRYEYGFELRTCRLCRQVLMFHNFTELGEEPTLVWQFQLEYDENPIVSMLSAIYKNAYEINGTVLRTPPLELEYTNLKIKDNINWDPFIPLPEYVNNASYDVIDLYGEGIPGILYRDSQQWNYRSPSRGSTTEGIEYEDWKPLPNIPMNSQGGMLMDINGDGYLDWLILDSKVSGSYSMKQDKTWSKFIPLKSLPIEIFHPMSQLGNVTGSSFTDLLMIGPKSVRIYAGEEGGFKKSFEVWQELGVTLPIEGINRKELVAFSDILGSGQSHLVRICYNNVTCWPNIGNGVFGKPLNLSEFTLEESEFNPDRVYLVDIDGSGASDIIYACNDHLLIYQNLSGNGFSPPIKVTLPKGVHFDNLCRLIPADIYGHGIASLVLNVPYMEPSSWCLNLFDTKPYLLKDTYNNLGVINSFFYRSSAQYWLDEKKSDSTAISKLPFPINLVSSIKTIDEIGDNTHLQKFKYKKGFYDQVEREFRGFAFIETVEEIDSSNNSKNRNSLPILTRSWYHTGNKGDCDYVTSHCWQGDKDAFLLKNEYFSKFDLQTNRDITLGSMSNNEEYWMYRSLKGLPLRSEIFQADNINSDPYTVESYRYQVRLVESIKDECITLPLQLEHLAYNYEQIASDPQCVHQISQFYDKYGFNIQSVSIQYPRRKKPVVNPYPDTLPDTSWDSSYDTQQTVLRITKETQSLYHLTSNESWRLGIPHQSRIDTFSYSNENIPYQSISFEMLSEKGTLESYNYEEDFGGQTEIIYINEKEPDIRALTFYTRSAVLDEDTLQVYEDVLNREELDTLLLKGGYKPSKRILGNDQDKNIFVAEQGCTRYKGYKEFYRIVGQQSSVLTGEQVFTWDKNYCVVTTVEDALENKVNIEFDYRFLQPKKIIDANNNVREVTYDAFGRVIYTRVWGTEKGVDIGFFPDIEFIPPNTVDEALSLEGILPVESCFVYDINSWMGRISQEELSKMGSDSKNQWLYLIDNKVITIDGRIRASMRSKLSLIKAPATILKIISEAKLMPPHSLSIVADSYPNNPKQQRQVNITFNDGLGRNIQSSTRAVKGNSINGLTDKWIISDYVTYTGKGEVLYTFNNFFNNSWEYISNKSISNYTYFTEYIYDILSRVTRTVNPKGYETRTSYYPWFTVSEDENDTM